MVALAAAIALGAFPVVRRITRRLERLRAQVDALGAGQLSARVDVRGKDEIASLAQSFNRAAERIEKLVSSQRGALASASHELRSPLARIRVAIELVDGAEGDALRARVAPDVAELDALIGELLLASRLDALAPGQALERRESVDLLGLAAEEAARTGAEVAGDPALVEGDPNLLRRLIRNLLENARRHGGGSDVEVWVTSAADRSGPRSRGPRTRGPRGRARADLRAVLPAGGRARVARRRLRPRPRAGAPDRAPPWRRRRAAARARAAEASSRSSLTGPLDSTPGVIAKPPFLTLAAFLAGGASSSGPTQIHGGWLRSVFGLSLVGGGVALVAAAMRQFRAAGTNIETDKPSETIVTTGLYARSRNPIYVAWPRSCSGSGSRSTASGWSGWSSRCSWCCAGA